MYRTEKEVGLDKLYGAPLKVWKKLHLLHFCAMTFILKFVLLALG